MQSQRTRGSHWFQIVPQTNQKFSLGLPPPLHPTKASFLPSRSLVFVCATKRNPCYWLQAKLGQGMHKNCVRQEKQWSTAWFLQSGKFQRATGNPAQQFPINKQVEGGLSTPKKKGCLIWATLLQQIGLSVQPGWMSGLSRAELWLLWWMKPWRGCSHSTRRCTALQGNASRHFLGPGASVDPTLLCLSLMLVS